MSACGESDVIVIEAGLEYAVALEPDPDIVVIAAGEQGPPGPRGAAGGGGAVGPVFAKEDRLSPAWATAGDGLVVAQAISVSVGSAVHHFAAGTEIEVVARALGYDTGIYATEDGRLIADTRNWDAPPGEPAGTTRRVGGCHMSLSGEISPYSLWDLNYRPSCSDPRGMVCINGMFWADIYLLGLDHYVNGTSRARVTIAHGENRPKIPDIFGGDGTAVYYGLTWFAATDILQSHGKRMPTWAEFRLLAFGVEDETSAGTGPETTQYDALRRSRWGVEQATGNLPVWSADLSPDTSTATAWQNTTGGRGQIYAPSIKAAMLGGTWAGGVQAGSSALHWNHQVHTDGRWIGARGVCDHLIL